MKQFVPRNKLSKRAKRMLDAKGRSFWPIHPATRCPPKSAAYDRKKARKETRKEIYSALSSSHMQERVHTPKRIGDQGTRANSVIIRR